MSNDASAATLAEPVAATLAPFRIAELFDPENRRAIASVAALLPAAASTFFGFECRLADDRPGTDFLACIAADGGQREALAKAINRNGNDPVWRRFAAFVETWAAPGSTFHDFISNLWVEFDLATTTRGPSGPSLFIGADCLNREAAASGAHAWLIEALAMLNGASPSVRQRGVVADCLAALPEGADLFQTGLMLSRPEPVLRLCLRGLPATGISHFLAEVGWPGPSKAVSGMLDAVLPLVDDIMVDLDAGDALAPKVGLECYISRDETLASRLEAFLVWLHESGLATAGKCRALSAWYGISHERWRPALWPAALRERSDRPSPGHCGVFERYLHHVKLVVHPDGSLEAKAYLASRFGWVDDKTLKQRIDQVSPSPARRFDDAVRSAGTWR